MINEYTIEKLDINEYEKCNNIWNMTSDPLTEVLYEDIRSGNRVVYVYKINGEFIAEAAYVFDMNDNDYTIAEERIYLSRLIVKPEFRNKGIGGKLIDFMIDTIRSMGYKEISIGVDKDNVAALNLYRNKGFTNIIFDGSDEAGEYFKLVKLL